MGEEVIHKPVLLKEILELFRPNFFGKVVDCTLGLGGHARALLEAGEPSGQLLGLEVDEEAIDIAKKNLIKFGERAIIVRESFAHLQEVLAEIKWQKVDAILVDLGVSSMQLDRKERGFTFRYDNPLDMRFDQRNSLTAEEIVNEYDEKELADIFYKFGEEKNSYRIARMIVKNRPIRSTIQLAELVKRAVKPSSDAIHPATRTFQALRIAVNYELEAIEKFLPQAIQALKVGGRLAIISFHSLEDRIVKQYFQKESRDCLCPAQQPICNCGHKASIRWMTKHVITPTKQEVVDNPRSRSAKLRVVEKVA